MPYTAPTLAQFTAELARSLGDPSKVFWLDDELQRIAKESLRVWNCYASYWRSRKQFPTVNGQHFYDLLSLGLVSSPSDQSDLLKDICYSMIEPIPSFPPSTFNTFPTTEQYQSTQINEATLKAIRQFQFDSGMNMTQEPVVGVPSAPDYIVQLNENVSDIRHFNIKLIPQNTYYPLRRIDEMNAQNWTNGNGNSLLDSGLPYGYSFLFPTSQPAIRLIPAPIITGFMEIISIRSNSFPPTDYNWPAKWLALSFLLTQDGQSRDHQRAVYCRKRYQDSVKLSALVPSIGIGYINNRPVPIVAASEMDTYDPSWRNRSGTPTAIVSYGWNLIGLSPIPDAIYDVSLEMFIDAPIPTVDPIQIAQEHLAAVLDYAKHIAIFKLGGAEFTATIPLFERFMDMAMSYNSKLKAEAMNFWTIRDRAARDKQRYNRRPIEPTSESTSGDIQPAAAVPGAQQ